MKAVAYIRVSTMKEEQELSLENQHDFFTRYVANRGDELVKIYSDKGKSGTKMKNRKELNAMLKAAEKRQFERLYVKDISRLFRNTLDFITVSRRLQELGIQLHLVNMGEGKDIDTFTLSLLALVAENESAKISERVKFGKRFSKENGIVPNFVFGYDRVDKYTLVPNPEESVWVQRIFDMYTEQELGMAKIAKYLYDSRVKTKKKKDGQPNYEWSQVSVSHILTNKLYVGILINGKESTKDIYTSARVRNDESAWYIKERPEFRIISDEQFEKAQKLIISNRAKFPSGEKNGTRRSDKHLFSNLIKCGCCGFSYRRCARRYSENTPQKVWWTCSKRAAYGAERCKAEYIRVEEGELKTSLDLLFSYLIQDKKAFFNLIESKCNAIIQDYIRETVGVDIEEFEDELGELSAQRERVKALAVKGLITLEEAERDMVPINKEIERVSFALNQTDKTRELTAKVRDSIRLFFQSFEHFRFTDNISNADLKRIVKKIDVVGKDEIYVYFNVDDDLMDLNFPIRLTGLYVPPDSDNRASKECETVEGNADLTDTNYKNGT